MSYNLLRDCEFKNNNWTFINCSYQEGCLTSSEKVFGIEQELILPDITKLYFRIKYKVNDINIKEIKIGIQNGKVLNINNKIPKINKEQFISVVDEAKQEKIKLHIIFESSIKINRVYIKEPILVDLINLRKSTWLKSILDKTLKFRNGYSYNNILDYTQIDKDNKDFINCNLEHAKIGSIIQLNNKQEINIKAKFNSNKYYLAKLDFEEINKFGNIYFQYGSIISERLNDQLYIVFKYNDLYNLKLIIEANDIIDYKVNLKNIMVIDITTIKLLKNDIPYLSFI